MKYLKTYESSINPVWSTGNISMKAKPLDLPVSWSKTKLHSVTVPWVENKIRSSCSVVERERFLTKSH